MSYTQKRIETRSNAEKLVAYLDLHQPTSIARVVQAGVLNARDAANALQYGIRHHVIERSGESDEYTGGAAEYRLTGRPLAPQKSRASGPSFDALLSAWGIARVAPQLSAISVRVIALG